MIQRPRYVKAFLAVVGHDGPDTPPGVPAPLRDLEADVFAAPGVRVYSFGSSTPTLDPPPNLGGLGWIKGRPFHLSPGPGLETLSDSATAVEPVLRNLDGKFSLLLRRSDGSLLCATDLLGSGAIFYSESAGRLFLSSHLGLLLAALPGVPPVDQLGLVCLLTLRRFVHGGTVWEGVSALPAGAYLSVRPAEPGPPSWTIQRYGEIAELLAGPTRTGKLEDLAAEYDELVRVSLRREAYHGPVALMLSGGHDSPVFALSLRNEGTVPFRAVTFGSRRSFDVLRARALAERLRIPHTVVPYERWDFSTYAERIASLNGGATSLEFSYQLPGYEQAGVELDTAIVGHLGNRLASTGSARNETFEHRWRRQTSWWGRSTPLVEQYYPDETAEVRELYRHQIEATAGLPPHRRGLLGADIGTGWQSLNFDVAETFLELSYPFFNRPLLSFAFNLPVDAWDGPDLYDAWYRQAYERARRRADAEAGVDLSRDDGSAALDEVSPGRPRAIVGTIYWRQRVRRSAEWLFEHIDRDCDDRRLRELCRASLRAHLDGDGTFVPIALMGLAPCLARAYLRPRPLGFEGVRSRGGRVWKRIVSVLR